MHLHSFNPRPTENAYFVIAMRVNPADVEIPEISTPDVDIGLDNAFLVVVFGCLKCDTSFALKVSTRLPNSDFYNKHTIIIWR